MDEIRPPWIVKVESLPEHIDSRLKPSLEEPSKVELKELPKHLKYVLLGKDATLPVIKAANLLLEQEETLLKVLSTHKAAIGWTIANLKGISPTICMHKIVTKPDAKPLRDAQRKLNPNIREVVKKEVLKWLDAGEDSEQLAIRPVTGWRVCIDYRKLKAATSKDHFLLPFVDQIVEKLSGKLKSKWLGPFVNARVDKFDDIEIEDTKKHMKQVVNGHRLKTYVTMGEEQATSVDVEEFSTNPPTYLAV